MHVNKRSEESDLNIFVFAKPHLLPTCHLFFLTFTISATSVAPLWRPVTPSIGKWSQVIDLEINLLSFNSWLPLRCTWSLSKCSTQLSWTYKLCIWNNYIIWLLNVLLLFEENRWDMILQLLYCAEMYAWFGISIYYDSKWLIALNSMTLSGTHFKSICMHGWLVVSGLSSPHFLSR